MAGQRAALAAARLTLAALRQPASRDRIKVWNAALLAVATGQGAPLVGLRGIVERVVVVAVVNRALGERLAGQGELGALAGIEQAEAQDRNQ